MLRSSPTKILCTVILAGIALVNDSRAATKIWDGGGGDGFFSTPENWDADIAASNGDSIQVGPDSSGLKAMVLDSDFSSPSVTFLATAPLYTTQSASGAEKLTLTGSGTTLLNSSSFQQKFQSVLLQTNVNQTWDGGASGFKLAGVNLESTSAIARTLTITNTGTSASNLVEFTSKVTGAGSLIKTGIGTLLFNSPSAADYAGTTTINGGTLQLARSNQIPDGSNMTLGGGTFNVNGFSDTVGTLTLSVASTIDFGSNALASSLVFGISSAINWGSNTLTISNFGANDSLRFGTDASALTSAQLANFRFNGTTPAQIDTNGFVTPVPEPSSIGLLGLAGLGLLARRRRKA